MNQEDSNINPNDLKSSHGSSKSKVLDLVEAAGGTMPTPQDPRKRGVLATAVLATAVTGPLYGVNTLSSGAQNFVGHRA